MSIANAARIAATASLWLIALLAEASELTAIPRVASDWQLARERNGVRTYERPVPDSAYAAVRAVTSVCATIAVVLDYVHDASHFDDWIPDTVEARALDGPSAVDRIYYLRSGLPWPVKDRDMIYRLRASSDPAHPEQVVVSMEGLPDLLPQQDGVVRMAAVSGQWRFLERRGRTEIVLQLHIDPGGVLPAALARRRIVGTPSRMLENLAVRFEPGCESR